MKRWALQALAILAMAARAIHVEVMLAGDPGIGIGIVSQHGNGKQEQERSEQSQLAHGSHLVNHASVPVQL